MKHLKPFNIFEAVIMPTPIEDNAQVNSFESTKTNIGFLVTGLNKAKKGTPCLGGAVFLFSSLNEL